MDSIGDRNDTMNIMNQDKYRESKNSNYDRVQDEIDDIVDNPTFKRDEDFD
jgi:hypothetical protein